MDIKTSVYDVMSSNDTIAKTSREIAEYVGWEFEDAGEFCMGMVEMKLPALTEPTAPTGSDAIKFKVWKMACHAYEKQTEARHQNSYKVYALILGQCSQALRNQMEASDTSSGINETSDVMKLLQLIQNCMIQCQTRQKPVHSLLYAEAQVYGFKQKTFPNNKYYEKFKDLVTNADQLGSTIRMHPERIKKIIGDIALDLDVPTDKELQHAKDMAKDEFLAVMFLVNCDHHQYGNLVRDIKNKYMCSSNMYPTSLSAAYDYIINYRPENQSTQHDLDEGGLSYYTEDGNGLGHGRGHGGHGGSRGGGHGCSNHGRCSTGGDTNGGTTPASTYNGMQGQRQTHTQTKGDTDDDAQFLQDNLEEVEDYSGVYSNFVGYTSAYSSTSLLLNSCSTVNLIANQDLLHGIHKARTTMRICCTAGVATTNLQGWLGNFPEPIWYIPQGMVNILSFYIVQKYYCIHCDTLKYQTFLITHPTGTTGITFHPVGKGLYALANPSDSLAFFGICAPACSINDWAHITTITNHQSEYTKHKYCDTILAHKNQNIIMFLSTHGFTKIANSQLIANLSIGQVDIAAAEQIFGPNLGALKGKTLKHRSVPVDNKTDGVPPSILKWFQMVVLALNVMFVNKIPFLITVLRGLHFSTVESLPNHQILTVGAALSQVINAYHQHGF